MTATAAELTLARSWIGNSEDEDTFNERYDRLYEEVIIAGDFFSDSDRRAEALNQAIQESLRSQLAAMTLDGPSSASAEGNSYSNAQNIITLQQSLKDFSKYYGTNQVRISKFVRNISR